MDLPIAHIVGPALGDYLGQTLTPEVAAKLASRILVQCYPGPVDLSGVEPKIVGSYVIECARAHEVLDELRPLHEAHWQETEGYRHGLPFAPDYERGLDLEQQGRYVLVVARHRESGTLVGNYGLYLSRSMHTQTLAATEDTLFLTREHRRGRLGIELMRYAEYALAQLGVREYNVSVKLVNDVGPMIERMGFVAVGKQYTKILPEVAHVLA